MSDNNKGLFEELEKISERINENLEGFYEITKKLKDSMPNLTEEFKKMNEEAGKLSEISKEIKISIKNETDFSTVMGTLASIATTITFARTELSLLKKSLYSAGKEIYNQIGEPVKSTFSAVCTETEKCANGFKKVDKTTSKLSGFKFGGIGSMDTAVELGMKLFEVFSNLMSNNEDFAAKMNELWEKITDALKPVMDAVISLFDSFTAGGEGSCSMMDTIAETVGVLAKTLAGVIEGISGLFKEHGDSIMSVVSAIGTFVSEIADMLVDVLGGAFDIITGIFSGNGEKIKEGFGDIWKGIKKIFAGFGDFFGGLWDKVVGIFKKIGTKIGDAIGDSFKSIINSIIGFAENTINGLIKQINNAIALINEIPGVNAHVR